jgi:hypothetical protein
MPFFARAHGFTSDQQVWDAVRNQQGYAVMRYDSHLRGLPAGNNFAPFTVEAPETAAPNAPYHPITIIGLTPANTHWPNILLSTRTAASITLHPSAFLTFYYFRLQPGAQSAQVATDLSRTLHTGSSFVITLSLLIGAGVAWWLAFQVAHQLYQAFPLPLEPLALLLLGGYAVAFVCTVLPARQAARVPPAEALRYE